MFDLFSKGQKVVFENQNRISDEKTPSGTHL